MECMGLQPPNIDGSARKGAVFTDWYGQQSCTAGRAAFITGQSPIRHRPNQRLAFPARVGLYGLSLEHKRRTICS